MNNYLTLFAILFLFFPTSINAQINNQSNDKIEQSIKFILQKIDKNALSDSLKYQFSKEAYTLVNTINNDSLKNIVLKKCVKYSFKTNNWEKMRMYITKHLPVAEKYHDSIGMARTLDYGGFYHYYNKEHPDSTYYYYYKSSRIYRDLGDSLRTGKALMNIAISQKNIGIYDASQLTTIEALTYLEKTNEQRRIVSLYNNLGIILNYYEDWDEALRYHFKSLEARKKFKNKFYYIQSLNNIGKVYKDKNDFEKAYTYFNKALAYDTLISQPKKLWLKATIIDNIAHTRFKENPDADILTDLMNALTIRKNKNIPEGIIVSYIHLAEYHKHKKNYSIAKEYAIKAEQLAKTKHLYRDNLESLKLLSSLYDADEAEQLLRRYIFVKDSIDKVDRNYKGFIARIQYEDKEKNQTIKELTKTTKKDKDYIAILLIAIAVLIAFSVVIFNLKNKQKKKLKTTESKLKGTELELEGTKSQFSDTIDGIEVYSSITQEADKRSIELIKNSKSFHDYLMEKYHKRLNKNQVLLWEAIHDGLSQKQLAVKFNVSVDTIKKWKKPLYSILKIDKNIMNKSKIASKIYLDELMMYKKYKINKKNS